MKQFPLLLFFLAAGLSAQGTPDCQFKVTFTTSGTTPSSGPAKVANFNAVTGGQPGCVSWRVTYQTNATSATSVQIEGAADAVSAGVHAPTGSYTALTPASGGGSGSGSTTNPATGTLTGQIVACCDYYPWIRINVNTLTTTGAGTQISLTVYGYKGTSAANLGNGGGGGTPSGPCGGDLGATFPNCTVLHLGNVVDASLQNAGLQNPSVSVNGTTCTLGSSCTVTAGSGAILGTAKFSGAGGTVGGLVVAGNVSGVTRSGSGAYAVALTGSPTNYIVQITLGDTAAGVTAQIDPIASYGTTGFTIQVLANATSVYDSVGLAFVTIIKL